MIKESERILVRKRMLLLRSSYYYIFFMYKSSIAKTVRFHVDKRVLSKFHLSMAMRTRNSRYIPNTISRKTSASWMERSRQNILKSQSSIIFESLMMQGRLDACHQLIESLLTDNCDEIEIVELKRKLLLKYVERGDFVSALNLAGE